MSDVPLLLQAAANVINLTETRIISRQRFNIQVPKMYLGESGSTQSPGGAMVGTDPLGTVYVVDPSITGVAVCNEGYGAGTLRGSWGNNDPDASISHLIQRWALFGQAQLRAFPYGYQDDIPDGESGHTFDPHGPDFVPYCDGLGIEATGFLLDQLSLYMIPGTALLINTTRDGLGSAFSMYDRIGSVSNINVNTAYRGIVCNQTDVHFSALSIGGCVKDGLTLGGGGGHKVVQVRSQGADRSCFITGQSDITNAYFEAARIGTHIYGAHQTTISQLNVGPGTCWNRCILIEANGCKIDKVIGTVMAPSDKHPDVAGIELMAGSINTRLLNIGIDLDGTAIGIIARGEKMVIDLCSSNNDATGAATAIKVASAVTQSEMKHTGYMHADACSFDFTSSNLNNVNGKGSVYRSYCTKSSSGPLFKYPGFGTGANPDNLYNLAAGNFVYADGVLQTTGMASP